MKHPDGEPFIDWPGWAHLSRTLLLYLLVTFWFILIYGGADWFTARHTWRIRVHFDAELSLPLIPAFTAVYMSIYLLFLTAPFVLRRREEVTALAMKQGAAIAVAGFAFLALPARLAYPAPTDLGMWEGLLQFADQLNLDYNLVPSLHVALSVICIEAYAIHASTAGRLALRLWGLLIAASTLFTHQHHIVDAVAGYALALSGSRVNWASLWLRGRRSMTQPKAAGVESGG